MGFVKQAAKVGLFGLSGLAATGAFKDKKEPKQSLVTGTIPNQSPSLINRGY